MGSKERKEREKKEMRDIILSSAMKLFISEGYDNVTIRNIAQKIEYSPATIYLYFKDKESIFFELQNQSFEKFYKKQLSIQDIEDPAERLTAHGKAYIDFAVKNPECYDLMFISRIPVREMKKNEQWDCGIRTYEMLKLNIKQCFDAGYFKGEDPDVTALSLWSFVHGISSLIIRERLLHLPQEKLTGITNALLNFLKRSY